MLEPAASPTAARRTALLALLCVLAFALRLVTHAALTAGGPRLLSVDDYGHLRRAVAIVRHFPRVPYADPFLGHPGGGRWIWPPLYDLAIATPARLLWGAQAAVERVLVLAAWLPPFLGALTLLPLAALARRALGDGAAIATAAAYAILPAAIVWSAYGHADQHVAEALCFVAVLAAAAAWLADGRDDWRALLPLGAALAAAVLVWQGAVFLAPVVGMAAWFERRARGAARALLVSALLVAPWAWIAGGPTTYISFGPFQPLFLALCAALVWLASWGRWGVAVAAGAALLALLVWAPITGALGHLAKTTAAASAGGAYLAYPREWLELIGEYRPLLSRGGLAALAQLSGGLLLLPIAWGFWVSEARRVGARRGPLVVLLCATPVVVALALAQRRYVYYLAPVVAIGLADVVMRLARRHKLAAGGLALAALLPAVPAIGELRAAPGAPGHDLLRTLARLALVDPPAADALRPETVEPGQVEGVLAPWAMGHLVTLYARRPTVADNFGYGFYDQARFFTTTPEEDGDALRQLVALRCGYVVATDLRPVLGAYAAAAGRPGVPLEATLAMRLVRSSAERPLPFLRLVVVSESAWIDDTGAARPRFKIYRVEPKGASG